MKISLSLLFFLVSTVSLARTNVHIATFDSGFGGFFTAKEIEKQSSELSQSHNTNFTISHYGDTANAPYGEKTPEKIAELSARGITKAFDNGAEYVFIACNTASTQFEAIKTILNKKKDGRADKIISIIDSSVQEMKNQIDEKLKTSQTVNVAILATPATIRAGAYLRAIAKAYNVPAPLNDIKFVTQDRWYKKKGDKIDSATGKTELQLAGGKKIVISQIGPGNWVDMIEHGAIQEEKKLAVKRDLALLAPKAKWDVVGEFCTHFPAIDLLIKEQGQGLDLSTTKTSYIKQGPLMAGIFKKMMLTQLKAEKPDEIMTPTRARIFISGNNFDETKELSKELFPKDPLPLIQQVSFQ